MRKRSKSSSLSAGLLMFRRKGTDLEVLLVHPGGPFFVHKEMGAWSIPKGEAGPDEDLLTRAQTEFAEELGAPAKGPWISLGSVRQKGGKIVHAWACAGDLPDPFQLKSNSFELEWPPHSGKRRSFAEVDQARFFPIEVARGKINSAQTEFLDRLIEALS